MVAQHNSTEGHFLGMNSFFFFLLHVLEETHLQLNALWAMRPWEEAKVFHPL